MGFFDWLKRQLSTQEDPSAERPVEPPRPARSGRRPLRLPTGSFVPGHTPPPPPPPPPAPPSPPPRPLPSLEEIPPETALGDALLLPAVVAPIEPPPAVPMLPPLAVETPSVPELYMPAPPEPEPPSLALQASEPPPVVDEPPLEHFAPGVEALAHAVADEYASIAEIELPPEEPPPTLSLPAIDLEPEEPPLPPPAPAEPPPEPPRDLLMASFHDLELPDEPPPPPEAVAPLPPLPLPEAPKEEPPALAHRASKPPPEPELPPPTLDLQANDFLPITPDELIAEAQDVRRAGPWFGRRDLIPPADDPRTKLIDRALVTHGLLSPEQLAEIHRVGAEMDRVRPTLESVAAGAAQAGEKAVEADRERRRQIKAQKKAEAAARKRQRAEAIAQRRASDIIFLGRGVSGRLNDRVGDREKLEALALPVLFTPAEVAAALGLSISKLRWLAYHNDVASRIHYVSFTVPKKSGGTRTLSAPHRTLKTAQEWILQHIVGRLPVEPPAHGFVGRRSILTNAIPHAQKAVVVNLDLQDFFPSIGFFRIRSVFERLGYSPAVATIFALLCTECPRRLVEYAGEKYHVALGPRGLPQGACTSPGLSNQVARRLDRRLSGLAKKFDAAYTRYADDITFSGGTELNARVGYLLAKVRHIAEDEGFAVHAAKTRVQRPNARQSVTGLVVNDRPGVARREVRRLRALLHRAKHEGLDKQNWDGRPDFLAWLRGKIAYVGMARPEVGARLLADLNALLTSESG